MMSNQTDQAKLTFLIRENAERLALVDALARQEEVSRAELYRRAMRQYLAQHTAKEGVNHE